MNSYAGLAKKMIKTAYGPASVPRQTWNHWPQNSGFGRPSINMRPLDNQQGMQQPQQRLPWSPIPGGTPTQQPAATQQPTGQPVYQDMPNALVAGSAVGAGLGTAYETNNIANAVRTGTMGAAIPRAAAGAGMLGRTLSFLGGRVMPFVPYALEGANYAMGGAPSTEDFRQATTFDPSKGFLRGIASPLLEASAAPTRSLYNIFMPKAEDTVMHRGIKNMYSGRKLQQATNARNAAQSQAKGFTPQQMQLMAQGSSGYYFDKTLNQHMPTAETFYAEGRGDNVPDYVKTWRQRVRSSAPGWNPDSASGGPAQPATGATPMLASSATPRPATLPVQPTPSSFGQAVGNSLLDHGQAAGFSANRLNDIRYSTGSQGAPMQRPGPRLTLPRSVWANPPKPISLETNYELMRGLGR